LFEMQVLGCMLHTVPLDIPQLAFPIVADHMLPLPSFDLQQPVVAKVTRFVLQQP